MYCEKSASSIWEKSWCIYVLLLREMFVNQKGDYKIRKHRKVKKWYLLKKTITSFAIVWRASQKSLTATWHSRFKVWRRSIKFIQNANSGFVGVAPQRLKRRSRRKSASQPQNWTWTSFWSPEEIYNTNGAVNFSLLRQK